MYVSNHVYSLPPRREESWELQQLRAECAKLMRKHQEDRQNLEDICNTKGSKLTI